MKRGLRDLLDDRSWLWTVIEFHTSLLELASHEAAAQPVPQPDGDEVEGGDDGDQDEPEDLNRDARHFGRAVLEGVDQAPFDLLVVVTGLHLGKLAEEVEV